MNKEPVIRNSKVLVTGGAGFIGSNLVEDLLLHDNFVVCLDNFLTGKKENIKSFLPHKNFNLIEGDIRNQADCKKSVQGVDYVLHQAALGSVPRSIKDPQTSSEININGFINMLMASRDEGVKRFIYASSSSVYGDSEILPKEENYIGTPLSPYAITKYTNELYAQNFSNLYGMETIGLRYFNVYGKRQDAQSEYAAVIPKFFRLLIHLSSPVIDGDGMQTRDFTYIDDVVRCNYLAALTSEKKALNTVYNVAYGKSTTINELFTEIKKIIQPYNLNIKNIQPTYGPEKPGNVKKSLASIRKAKELLGYKPLFPVHEGLHHTILYYNNQ